MLIFLDYCLLRRPRRRAIVSRHWRVAACPPCSSCACVFLHRASCSRHCSVFHRQIPQLLSSSHLLSRIPSLVTYTSRGNAFDPSTLTRTWTVLRFFSHFFFLSSSFPFPSLPFLSCPFSDPSPRTTSALPLPPLITVFSIYPCSVRPQSWPEKALQQNGARSRGEAASESQGPPVGAGRCIESAVALSNHMSHRRCPQGGVYCANPPMAHASDLFWHKSSLYCKTQLQWLEAALLSVAPVAGNASMAPRGDLVRQPCCISCWSRVVQRTPSGSWHVRAHGSWQKKIASVALARQPKTRHRPSREQQVDHQSKKSTRWYAMKKRHERPFQT